MPTRVVFRRSTLALLLETLGFEPVFESARMFSGIPPQTETTPFQAIAAMQLGEPLFGGRQAKEFRAQGKPVLPSRDI